MDENGAYPLWYISHVCTHIRISSPQKKEKSPGNGTPHRHSHAYTIHIVGVQVLSMTVSGLYVYRIRNFFGTHRTLPAKMYPYVYNSMRLSFFFCFWWISFAFVYTSRIYGRKIEFARAKNKVLPKRDIIHLSCVQATVFVVHIYFILFSSAVTHHSSVRMICHTQNNYD